MSAMLIVRRTFVGILAVAATVVGIAEPARAATATATTATPVRAHLATHAAAPARGHAALQTARALAAVPGCGGAVALGSTSTCDFPAQGGTTRYRVHVTGPDTIRMRAAVPDGVTPTVTVSSSDGTALCSQFTRSQGECAVPAAGNYLVDVTLDRAATAYTTIDSARTPGSCAATVDDRVNRPGVTVDLPTPGSSWCALVPADADDVLQAELDSNDDDLLRVAVYNDAGTAQCTMAATAFGQSQCTLGSGSGFRLFATFDDDAAESTTLFLSDVSHPKGCVAGAPDGFGAAPSRSGTIFAHRMRCYTFSETAGHHIGVHPLGKQSGRDVSWTVRYAAGQVLCSGLGAQTQAAVANCAIPSTGSYTLFVYTRGSQNAGFVASLTDLSSAAGCSPVTSTSWGHAPDTGTLSQRGQVDCLGFSGTQGHRMRMTNDSGPSPLASALLVDPSGATVCTFAQRTDCGQPSTGSYRVIESTAWPTAVTYRVWATDTDSTAGCTPTTPDALSHAPSRTGHLDTVVIAACWSFAAPAAAAYFVRTAITSGSLTLQWELRSIGGHTQCSGLGDIPGPCLVGPAGTYLVVASPGFGLPQSAPGDDVLLGFWRVDRPDKCAQISTSFAAAATGAAISAPLQANCTQFTGSAGQVMVIRTETDPSAQLVHAIVNGAGSLSCIVAASSCRLTGDGPYRVISYSPSQATTRYRFRVASVSNHAGCPVLAPTAFGRAPSRALSLDGGSDIACYELDPASPGGIGLRMVQFDQPDANTRLNLYRSDGAVWCSTTADFQTCLRSGPSLLLVTADTAVSGKLGWLDLTRTDGCTSVASLDFGAPTTPQQIVHRGVVKCLTVPTAATDWVRMVFAVAGSGADLRGRFVDGSGATVCDLSSAAVGVAVSCRPGSAHPGPYRVLVWTGEDGTAFDAVSRLHVWRVTDPVGCVDGGTFGTGFGPLVGTLADPNDETCYLFRGRPGQMSLTTSNDDVPDELPRVQIMRANGSFVCVAEGSGTCLLPVTGEYTLLVMRGFSTTTFSGHYRVSGECTSPSCGPALART